MMKIALNLLGFILLKKMVSIILKKLISIALIKRDLLLKIDTLAFMQGLYFALFCLIIILRVMELW